MSDTKKYVIFDISSIIYSLCFQKYVLDEIIITNYDAIKYYTFKYIFEVLEKFSPINKVYVCFDSPHSWRKNIYPEYKKNRKQQRNNLSIENGGTIDWKKFFQTIDELYNDIKNNFPFFAFKIPNVEADDIVYYIIKHLPESDQKIIISRDSDYVQLYIKYKNILLYDAIQKKFKDTKNPEMQFLIKMCCGDRADNIPPIKKRFGIKSAEKFILSGEYNKLLEEEEQYFKIFGKYKSEEMNLYIRNKKLIDFEEIPQDILQRIQNEIESTNLIQNNVNDYFINKKYRIFIENLFQIHSIVMNLETQKSL